MSESLARRLLRLNSGGCAPILSGRALKHHLGPELDRALRRRVLVELPKLDEWPPCAGCDQDCEARPIRELDGRLVAMCPHDSSSDEVLSDQDVRQFQLDLEELCLAIRDDSGLSGDGPKQIAPGIWSIGRAVEQERPFRAVFLAFETDLGGTAIVAMLRRLAGPTPAVLVLAGQADSEVGLTLEDAGIVALTVSELMAGDEGAPFGLDHDLLIWARPRPRLALRHSDRSVTFDGRSGILPPQPFQLLLFMLREAEAGRPLVDNSSIEAELSGKAIGNRPAGDAIRRLRDALAPMLGGRAQARRLIQNRPGSYFIDRGFADIEII